MTFTERDKGPQSCQSLVVAAEPTEAFSLHLNCSVGGTHCVHARCGPFPLLSNQHDVTLDIRANLLTDQISDGVNMFSLTSLARLSVPKLDHLLAEFDNYPNVAVYTTQYSPEITTGGVATWVIIVSVLLSLLLLFLIILGLVKLKFFQRKTNDQKALLDDQKAAAGFNVTAGVDRENKPLIREQADQGVAL